MKRQILLPAAIAVIIGLTGCDALFNQENMFASLEPNLADEVKGKTGSDLLSALGDTSSNTLNEDLAADPAAADAVLAELENIIIESTDPAIDEEAAIYYSEIMLGTSEVGDVVNSLVGAIMTSDASSGSADTDLLNSVLAPVSGLDQQEFMDFIADIQELAGVYEALALANETTGTTLSADIAQAAAVVLVIDTLINASTNLDPVVALYESLSILNDGDSSNDNTVPLTFPLGYDFTGTLFSDPAVTTDDTSLEIILNAARLDTITDLISTLGSGGSV